MPTLNNNIRNFIVDGKTVIRAWLNDVLFYDKLHMELILTVSGNEFRTNQSPFYYRGSSLKIDWGDGTVETYTTGSLNHGYTDGLDTHTVRVSGVLTGFREQAFRESNVVSAKIPEGITSLPNSCFYRCTSLESITIPKSLTSLGNSCFFMCTSLESITIPESVTSLQGLCFYNCTNLSSLILNWNTADSIIRYNPGWLLEAPYTKFIIPPNTASDYIAKDYPSSRLCERGLTLTSDKDIIETGETATLTSVLYKCAPVPDERVNFYEVLSNDGVTLTLDGNKSVIVDSETVTMTATLTDGDDNPISDSVVDVWYDDPWWHLYYNTKEVSRTTMNGSTIYDNRMSVKLPTNCEIIFDIYSDNPNASSEHRFFLMPKSQYSSGTTQPTDALLFDFVPNNNSLFGKRESGTSSHFGQTLVGGVSTYHTIKLIKTGKEVQFYIDDVLKATETIDWIDDYTDYTLSMMRWNASGTSKIRNVEINRR